MLYSAIKFETNIFCMFPNYLLLFLECFSLHLLFLKPHTSGLTPRGLLIQTRSLARHRRMHVVHPRNSKRRELLWRNKPINKLKQDLHRLRTYAGFPLPKVHLPFHMMHACCGRRGFTRGFRCPRFISRWRSNVPDKIISALAISDVKEIWLTRV